jgi:hypothetical protein
VKFLSNPQQRTEQLLRFSLTEFAMPSLQSTTA